MFAVSALSNCDVEWSSKSCRLECWIASCFFMEKCTISKSDRTDLTGRPCYSDETPSRDGLTQPVTRPSSCTTTIPPEWRVTSMRPTTTVHTFDEAGSRSVRVLMFVTAAYV